MQNNLELCVITTEILSLEYVEMCLSSCLFIMHESAASNNQCMPNQWHMTAAALVNTDAHFTNNYIHSFNRTIICEFVGLLPNERRHYFLLAKKKRTLANKSHDNNHNVF